MKHRRLQGILFAGAVIALPLCASGHGSEFLLAKVLLLEGGGARLEVTADYGDNPMLTDEKAATAAATGTLRARFNSTAEELSLPQIEKRDQPDPSSPLPPDPLTSGQPHQLVTATWQLAPRDEALQLQVREDSGQSVVLWTMDERQPEEKPRWVMLVSGEQSPPIQLPRKSARDFARWILIATGLLLATGGLLVLRQLRPRLSAPIA